MEGAIAALSDGDHPALVRAAAGLPQPGTGPGGPAARRRVIYRVRHTTRYAYGSTVDLAAHMLHLRPRDLPWQRVVSAGISTLPEASRRRDGVDHFGNAVTWLFIDAPHDVFEVTAEAEVEVRYPDPPAAEATLPWEQVARAGPRRRPRRLAGGGIPLRQPDVPGRPGRRRLCGGKLPGGPAGAGRAARPQPPHPHAISASAPGVTDLHTPVTEMLRRREGVCQDFTNLMISGLRAIGLPARYMSGYIRTRPPAGQPRRRGADQSHAWVGAWMGPEHGWVELDPTNNVVVRDEHVVLGWGRDYGDISPVRGVMLGGGDHGLEIGVDLEPVGEEAAAEG